MAKYKSKKFRGKIFSSYLTTTISVTLVLFLIGIMGFVLINTDRLSDYVREKIGFTLVLQEGIKEVEIIKLQKLLSSTQFVKSTRYVDKETAAKELQEELGENFTGFLGFNPLFSSIDVKLFADYTNSDSLSILEKKFLDFPEIKEVYYQRNLVTLINENVRKISLFLLVFSSLLTLIFFALINNTIRISIYSQRFIINTMQLVGATRSFIRKPFIRKSLVIGIYGALLAFIMIVLLIYTYQKELNGILNLNNLTVLGLVFGIMLVTGIVISWLSTFLAVNKFLKLKFDELFY
jgi:cell division transport system permease protein